MENSLLQPAFSYFSDLPGLVKGTYQVRGMCLNVTCPCLHFPTSSPSGDPKKQFSLSNSLPRGDGAPLSFRCAGLALSEERAPLAAQAAAAALVVRLAATGAGLTTG